MPFLDNLSSVAARRLGLGLLQGLTIYLLVRAIEQTSEVTPLAYGLSASLLVATTLAPVWVLGMGQLACRRQGAWLAILAVILSGLAVHDLFRRAGGPLPASGLFDRPASPSAALMMVVGPMLFIANTLFVAAQQEGRAIAGYGRYFDVAWKQGVQLAFAANFVGTMWLVLWLGAALFSMLNLDFFQQTIRKPWFYWSVSFMAMAGAIHLTDVAPSIIAGIRRLALVLLSWLLPLMVLIALGFLVALAATSLDLLWQTRRGALLLLIAAGVLVALANTAYQQGPPGDGGDGHVPPRPLAWAGSAVGPILVVLVGLAAYATLLRVGQYGWTSDRVLLATTVAIAGLYAVGYTAAGWWNGSRRRLWEATNVGVSFVTIAVLLALLSPLADPARIAVDSQWARLRAGSVSADAFDVVSLRFDGERYGAAVLRRLADGDDPALAAKARTALDAPNRWQGQRSMKPEIGEQQVAANLTVAFPSGAPLPDGLAKPKLTHQPCFNEAGKVCDVVLLGPGPGGKPMAGVFVTDNKASIVTLLVETERGRWLLAGNFAPLCDAERAALRRGEFSLVVPLLPDMMVGGRRLTLLNQPQPRSTCP